MAFKKIIKIFFHLFLILFLTALTQIGGFLYISTLLLIHKNKSKYKIKRGILFTVLYLLFTFLLIPKIAPYFGRVKIEDNYIINSHSFFTKLCNRNYVNPKLKNVLTDVSLSMQKENPGIKLIYLDANFPFINGFPLLPHLSHNDGKKIDISFIYEDKNGRITNLKPSNSGYGIFEEPNKKEINQITICKENGFWQYDFTKYLTFGTKKKDLKISEKATKSLINSILKYKNTHKIFIEPHLKRRMNLKNPKIRFHGCSAVRHDDHIHFQIK
ncbi:MAG: hypothetical protein AB8B78_01125 [Polaribacter sp.]